MSDLNEKLNKFIDSIKQKFAKDGDATASKELQIEEMDNEVTHTNTKKSLLDTIKEKFSKNKQEEITVADGTMIDEEDLTQTEGGLSEDDIGENSQQFNADEVPSSDKTEVFSTQTNIDGDDLGEITAKDLHGDDEVGEEGEEAQDDEGEEDSEPEKKSGKVDLELIKEKIKNLTPIQKVIVGCLVALIAFEFIIPEEKDVPLATKPKVTKPKKNKKNDLAKKEKAKKEKERKDKLAKEKADKEREEKLAEEAKRKEEEAKRKEEEEAKKAIAETPKESPTKASKEKEEPVDVKVGENKIETINTQTNEPKSISESSLGEQKQKAKKSLEEIIEEQKNVVKVEEIIEEDYQPMPDYEQIGRGLVYNCKGKHWACVNRLAFFQCRSNKNWNERRSKKPECITVNVYQSSEDCRTVQVYNINTSVATDFCKSE